MWCRLGWEMKGLEEFTWSLENVFFEHFQRCLRVHAGWIDSAEFPPPDSPSITVFISILTLQWILFFLPFLLCDFIVIKIHIHAVYADVSSQCIPDFLLLPFSHL